MISMSIGRLSASNRMSPAAAEDSGVVMTALRFQVSGLKYSSNKTLRIAAGSHSERGLYGRS